MTASSHDPNQPFVVPARAPRKQSFPHRAPSSDDTEPGRIFTVAFGSGSPFSAERSRSNSWATISSCHTDAETSVVSSPRASFGSPSCSLSPIIFARLPDQDDVLRKENPIQTSVVKKVHYGGTETILPPPQKMASPERQYSLADQYLDTMVMDDFWRSACLRKIHQNERRQQIFAIPRVKPHSHHKPSHLTKPLKPHMKPHRPKSPQNVKRRISKTRCQTDTDSGFASSSPAPNYLRIRSTRNYPTYNTAMISIDVPASMTGRSCLSCGCTNTTCWRRTLGGIICNSCGLRYKKCGIICADVKCRYIPTRSEIRELLGKGARAGSCYACRGKVISHQGPDVVECQ